MVEIRDFTKEDAKAVARLIPQLTVNIFNSDGLEKRIEDIINESQSKAIVAVINNKVVGFALLAWYTIPSKGLITWIEEVIVDENERGKGIGKEIMEKLIEIAKSVGCRQIKLTVNNFIAQKLYESLGFTFKETEVMIKKI
jgi:phosphinothricin acetyltransferase